MQDDDVRETKEHRKSLKELRELNSWEKERADGSEPTIQALEKRHIRHRDLVFRHLKGRGYASERDLLEAGHRIPPTGRWTCLHCNFMWAAKGPVPAQWWTPANNAFTPTELKAMPDPPPWHCRIQLPGRIRSDGTLIQCGVYAKTIPVPDNYPYD